MEISLTEKKLKIATANDVNSNGSYGYAVDVDGNYAIVTKKGHQENFNTSYIFKKTGENWNMLQDISGQPIGYDGFGIDAKIKNDLIMVSSRTYYSDASQRASNEKGGIHVYKLNSGTDTFEAFNPATLNPTDKSTYGYDNAGNYDDNWGPFNFPAGPDALPNVLVPGPNYDGSDTTQFYKGGIPDNPNAEFSTFFDLYYSNNIYTVIVGHPGTNEFYIFRHDENDASKGWLRWKYNPSTVGAQNQNYDDVAIYGDYVFLSYTSDDSNKGKVIIYKYDSTQANFADKWQKQTTDLVPATLTADERFGRSLSVYDDYLIVGTENEKAYIYKKDINNEWTNASEKILTPKTVQSNARFGITVSIGKILTNFYAIVGSTQKTVNGQTNEGAFYLYRLLDDEWTQRDDETDGEFVHATGDNPSSTFSNSLSIKNNQIIVGASAHSANTTADNSATTYTGAVYIYTIDDQTPSTLNIGLSDLSNNFLVSNSLVTTNEIDDYLKDTINIKSFNQTESNTFFTDLSNNPLTNPIMTYIGLKIVKITSSLGEFVANSLYTSLDTANDSFTFDNLVDVTAATIFDASNNADISVGDTTPTTNEKEIFKAAKTLSFRKLRKDLKSTELETKIKDISATDVDANITTYLNTINQNLSLDLNGFDLSGIDLTDTDLSGATLVGTDLSGANLTNANLTYVDISGADITNTNLKNSTFTDISNVQNSTGVALNVPYKYQYLNNQLTASTTNLTQSYTTNKTKIGPFKEGEKISINGVQIVLGSSVSEAGLLGIDKNQDGDSFTFLKDDNNIETWGNPYTGGNQSTDVSNVKAIFSSKRAKSAICENGKVFSWGDIDYGADAPADLTGVIDIKSNEKAFAALYHNGDIVCWGDTTNGGSTPSDVSNVVQLYSNKSAFTALSSDGTIKSWGTLNSTTPPTDNKFVDVFSTDDAFTGLKSDGTVKCWGSSESRQNTPPTDLSNVSFIFSNQTAFASLLGDGTVQCWGNTANGGITPTDISNVDTIYSTNTAFTALLNDGNIVCWGNSTNGGTKPVKTDKEYNIDKTINVTMTAEGDFIFQDISSTIGNLSFATNQTSASDRTTNLGFVSGTSIYLKNRLHDGTYGKVFVSENEYDTSVKDHTFLLNTHPFRSYNNDIKMYIGFVKSDSTYYNKYATSIFTYKSNENPYIYLNDPNWILTAQTEITLTMTSSGLTVTSGESISVLNGSSVTAGKYRLVVQIESGVLEIKNAFETSYPVFEYGKTYKFNQSHWTNNGNTLKFSSTDISGILNEKSTSTGTPGTAGANTILRLTDDNIHRLYTYSAENRLTNIKNHKLIQFEIKKIIVTVVNNKFVFDNETGAYPILYHNALCIFDVSHTSNVGHTLSFSKDNSTTDYNVNRMGTPGSEYAIVTYKNNNIENLNINIFCKQHGMGMGSHYNPIPIAGIIEKDSITNFEKIFSTQTAFAGLKRDGTLITWGNSLEGGVFPTENTISNLTNKYDTDIRDVVINTTNFCSINVNDGLIQSTFDINSSNYFSQNYNESDKSKLCNGISKVVTSIYFGGDDRWDTFATAICVLRKDGSVIAFGDKGSQTEVTSGSSEAGGNPYKVLHLLKSNCVDVVACASGFCVLKDNGTIVVWGSGSTGGNNIDTSLIKNVKKISSHRYGYAVLKNDGTVFSWGQRMETFSWDTDGYFGDQKDTYNLVKNTLTDIVDIISCDLGFAAIKDDGTGNNTYKAICWGCAQLMEPNHTSYGVREHDGSIKPTILESGIKKIFNCGNSFVFVKSDKKAYTLGRISKYINTEAEVSQLTDIKEVTHGGQYFYSPYVFTTEQGQDIAFLKYDGSVVCPSMDLAHSTTGVRDYTGTVNTTVLDSNIVKIFSNNKAFCALSNDGKVYCWGRDDNGGNMFHTSNGLPPHLTISDVTDIVKVSGGYNDTDLYTKEYAGGFIALKKDGQIIYWGKSSSSITGVYKSEITKKSFVDVTVGPNLTSLSSLRVPFYYALHKDGSLYSLGYNLDKHKLYRYSDWNHHDTVDSETFQSFLPGTYKAPKTVVRWDMEKFEVVSTTNTNSDFENVFSTDKAFAAIKKDGSVIVWGDENYGGKQSNVENSQFKHLFSNSACFAGIKSDNTQFVWGKNSHGALEYTDTDLNISSNLQEINSYIEPYRKSNLLAMYGIHSDTRKILEESYNSNESANIILNTDGTATTWGNTTHGGVSSNLTLTNVKEVVTGGNNMTVLKSDGTLTTWSNNTDQITTATNVKKVVSGLSGNVIALKADGTVEYWDPDLANWNIGSNINTANLPNLTGVVDVFAFDNTFAALDKDDALTVWGDDPALEPFNSAEKKKLTFDNNATSFGQGLAINDTYAFISAPASEENSNSQSGCVFVYKKDEGGTDNWGQIKKITPKDDSGNDDSEAGLLFGGGSDFGYAIRGESNVTNYNDYLAVGTSNYSSRSAGDGEGAVYIFKKDEGGADNWGQIKKITVSSLNYFGMSVKLYEDYLIVGTVGDGAYIFKKDQGGTDNWGQFKILNPSVNAELTSGNGGFGYPVAIHNNHIAVSSLTQEKVYIFQKDHGGSDNWGEINTVIGDDGDRYGKSIAIYDDYMTVGAMYWDGGKTNDGAVYVYKKDYDPLTPNDISANAWGQLKILSSPNPANGNTYGQKQFGICTSIYGDYIIGGTWQEDIEYNVTASVGAAYIFKKDEGGPDNWGQVKKLQASDKTAYHKFGHTCTIDNNFLMVGRPVSDGQKGGAYIFDLSKPSTDSNLLTNISSKAAQLSSGVKEVIANSKVLIALKYDGTVVTQGDSTLGGDISNSDAQYKLYGGTADNIARVYVNNKFALALKKDRTCVYWGDISRNATLFNFNISAFTNIRDIVYSNDVMIGVKYDGTIVGLGEKSKGGNPSSLLKDVEKVFATTNNGFTALKTDGSFVVWGDTSYGGQL